MPPENRPWRLREADAALVREIARRHGDFAMAIVSALVLLDVDGRISRAAVCVSAVEPVPVRLTAVESMLVGQIPSPDLHRAAGIHHLLGTA